MKKLLTILTFLLSSSLFCNELAWVDEQVKAIKPARDGMNSRALLGINDPFVFLKKVQKDKKLSKKTVKSTIKQSNSIKNVRMGKKVLTLSLILNNSAMINDIWYKKGDSVNGYKITEVSTNSVILTKKKKQLLLSTRNSSKNLKFKNN